jgi:hypothetical protein
MAYQDMPVVRNGLLHLPDSAGSIQVDSDYWFAWLEEAQRFSYMSTRTTYRMTVRKEKRRSDLYWYAYLKDAGKLHNAYVGRSQAATAQRLEETILRLVTKAREFRSSVANDIRIETGCVGERSPTSGCHG